MPYSPETDPEEFAARLREAMGPNVRGETAHLAKRYGVKMPTVTGWMKGKHLPEAEKVKMMASDYKVEFNWLYFGQPPKLKGPGDVAEVAEPRSLHLASAPADSFSIPQLDVRAAMGSGAFTSDHVEILRNIAIDVVALRREVNFSSAKNLRFITGYGPSMEDTFFDGDTLLVDTGVRTLEIDAVYVFVLNDQLYIKTLQRRPDGTVLMISDNKRYEPYLIQKGDQLDIQGRILLAWNVRKL